MTSVVIIADSGADMARMTAIVHSAPGMVLVRHASGRVPVASIVADHQPGLIVLGEMSPRRLVIERLAEIRSASPASRTVVVASNADARWLGAALAAGAHAVVPGGPSADALGVVLQEVLQSDPAAASSLAQAA